MTTGSKVATSLTSVVFALLVVEAGLRVADIGYLNAPSVSSPLLHHVHPLNYRFRTYDPGGEFSGHLLRYGADGAVVDPVAGDEVASAAPARLAVLGDSFVEAVQVPFAQSLVGRLASATTGRAVVRNFGVTGYSPILYFLQWRMTVRSWKPTHVLVLLYSNDIDDDREYARGAVQNADGLPSAVPGPSDLAIVLSLHHSYVARLAALCYRRLAWMWSHRNTASAPVGGYVEANPDISPLTSSLLAALARDVRANGAEFVLSAVPSKARLVGAPGGMTGPEFAAKCRVWAAAHGVPFVDLVPAFRNAAASGRHLFFQRDIHLSADGHAVAADTICRALKALCGLTD